MVSSKKLYRRVSVTRGDGQSDKYDAHIDIEADPETGIVTHTVHSQALTGKVVRFRSNGNAADDAIHLERICQGVYEFDQSYRVRAVPKPASSSISDYCHLCGDVGWIEDETGYPDLCTCRT